MYRTDSRQRTVPVTCSISPRTISSGLRMALARKLATNGTVGDFTDTFASASAITSAAGFIREQWKGADTGRSIARLAPLALSCFRRHGRRCIKFQTDKGRHRPSANGDRFLHGLSAYTQ